MDRKLLQDRESIPHVPKIAIKVQTKTLKQREHLNRLLRSLDSSDFIVRMFKSVTENVYFVVLDLSHENIEKEATFVGYPVKAINLSAKVPFSPEIKDKVIPLVSKDI